MLTLCARTWVVAVDRQTHRRFLLCADHQLRPPWRYVLKHSEIGVAVVGAVPSTHLWAAIVGGGRLRF